MQPSNIHKVRVVDSHTGGEPTRVVIEGGPDLGNGSLADRLAVFRDRHDEFRSAVVSEPRGSDVMVGALLCEPVDPFCATGVIFFNNVGYLGMCGHGTIGAVATLEHLGRIGPGDHDIETPAGAVTATLHRDGQVSVRNVPSYRLMKDVEIETALMGRVRGDVAWGGNWFFLVHEHREKIELGNVEQLVDCAWEIRQELDRAHIAGPNGEEIDHVELFAPSQTPGVNSRNFVLCPGRAYDRSPCGTGTSAKLACLYEDGVLQQGQVWRQESIVGSVFEASIVEHHGRIYPTIKGSAYVNAESTLILDSDDPFCMGIR